MAGNIGSETRCDSGVIHDVMKVSFRRLHPQLFRFLLRESSRSKSRSRSGSAFVTFI
ncbi:hypothetical protein Hanom_Chr07g00585141 [Helianthus anomalus]